MFVRSIHSLCVATQAMSAYVDFLFMFSADDVALFFPITHFRSNESSSSNIADLSKTARHSIASSPPCHGCHQAVHESREKSIHEGKVGKDGLCGKCKCRTECTALVASCRVLRQLVESVPLPTCFHDSSGSIPTLSLQFEAALVRVEALCATLLCSTQGCVRLQALAILHVVRERRRVSFVYAGTSWLSLSVMDAVDELERNLSGESDSSTIPSENQKGCTMCPCGWSMSNLCPHVASLASCECDNIMGELQGTRRRSRPVIDPQAEDHVVPSCQSRWWTCLALLASLMRERCPAVLTVAVPELTFRAERLVPESTTSFTVGYTLSTNR